MNPKRLLICAAAAALTVSSAFAFDTENIVPKGKVSTYTKINYIIVSKFGEYYRTQATKYVHVFNERGKETETLSYDSQNRLVDKVTFDYDTSGRLVITNYFDTDDNFMYKKENEYTPAGKILSETEYNADGVLTSKTIYGYEGSRKIQSFYDRDGVLMSRIITKLSDTGVIEEENEPFISSTLKDIEKSNKEDEKYTFYELIETFNKLKKK